MEKIILVFAADSCEHSWVDSCWTEDKEEEATRRALEIREAGLQSAVLTHAVNVTSNGVRDAWDFDLEEMLLEWNR